jgi:hypothetical protein
LVPLHSRRRHYFIHKRKQQIPYASGAKLTALR